MKKNKSAALLIVMVLIAVISIIIAVSARSAIASVLFTTNTTDAMIAESASKAGIEYGIYQFNKNGILSLPQENYSLGNNISFDITIISTGLIRIESIGIFGRVREKHSLTQTE